MYCDYCHIDMPDCHHQLNVLHPFSDDHLIFSRSCNSMISILYTYIYNMLTCMNYIGIYTLTYLLPILNVPISMSTLIPRKALHVCDSIKLR